MVDQLLKDYVLNYLQKNCHGYQNAKKRRDILLDLGGIPDRTFRFVIHDLVHDGHVESSHKRGYWFKPVYVTDPGEIKAQKQAILERKKKALSMLEGCDKDLGLLSEIEQQQMTFAGVR